MDDIYSKLSIKLNSNEKEKTLKKSVFKIKT